MATLVEKIVDRLRNDATLKGLLNPTKPVGFIEVPQGTARPYVLVSDISGATFYDFDNVESHTPRTIDIEVVADQESPTGHGYGKTQAALDRVKVLLDGSDSSLLSNDGSVICLRRVRPLSSRVLTQSGGERFLRRGHEWQVVTSPDS